MDKCDICGGAIFADETGCPNSHSGRTQQVQQAIDSIMGESIPLASPASTMYRACGFTLVKHIEKLEDGLKGATVISNHSTAIIQELRDATEDLLEIVEAELEDDTEDDDLASWHRAVARAKRAMKGAGR